VKKKHRRFKNGKKKGKKELFPHRGTGSNSQSEEKKK